MSFISPMKDKTGGIQVQMVFIRLMKDKTGGSQVQNGLHKADEGQNKRDPGSKWSS
ncbi:hypothetical protein [Neobacillus mesonae]|uniref:hypothetical protein n=1 Tax=Neobacillus mesonae TaxID=1193713 RepID=UPI000A50AA5F|nr:hypothetical protein [Neobacillus mesonae]